MKTSHGVVASDLFSEGAGFFETLSAAAPLIGQGLVPDERVGATEERIDVFDFAGVGIVHLAGNCRVVLDRLDERQATMRARIEAET